MKLNRNDVLHLASLARMKLSEEEIELFRDQMSSILDYVEQLRQVDVTDVNPTGHGATEEGAERKDKVVPSRIEEEIFDRAPEKAEREYKVRAVFD